LIWNRTKELKQVEKLVNDIDDIGIDFGIGLSIDNKMINIIPVSYFFDKEENKSKIPKSIKNMREDDNPILRISDLK